MYLEEMTAGFGVTFYVNIGNTQQLVFESKITEVDPKKHYVFTEAIIKDDKVLSFRGKGVVVDMVVAIPDDKPLLFQNISMETLRLSDNSYCYNISAPKEGVGYNRRGSFRCFVGNRAILKGGKDLQEYEVIIKDVSTSGFAITCGPELELIPDQLVHVLLEEYIEDVNQNYSFHLYGLMVRKQELDHGKVVYGFRLNNHVGGLENYVTQKERLRIKKARGR